MIHFIVIMHFIAISVGVITLSIVWVQSLRQKNMVLQWIFYADLMFTMNMILDAIRIYFSKNVATMPQDFWLVLGFLMYLFSIVTIYTSAKLVSITIEKPLPTKLLWIFCLASLAPIVEVILKNFLDTAMTIYIVRLFFELLLLGCVVYGVKSLPAASAPHRPITIAFLAALVVYWLVYSLTNLVPGMPLWFNRIPYTQIIYLVLNILGLVYLLKGIRIGAIHTQDHDLQPQEIDYLKTLENEFALTNRELEIVSEIIEGNNNKEIGEKLFISPNTVKNHIYNIYKKAGIKSRYELIALITQSRSKQL